MVWTLVHRGLWLGALALAGVALAPARAEACGGTFCDVNRGVPVNQAAETVLFNIDGDSVEVHIQFNYTGDPDRFGWVIPVPADPEFEVGSQPLFDLLNTSTLPQFTRRVTVENCWTDDDDDTIEPPNDDGDGAFSCGAGGPPSGLGNSAPDPEDEPYEEPEEEDEEEEPETRQLIGAFEVDILRASTVEELEQWLDDNEYQRDPDAPPIFRKYLEEGFVFAGVKLRPGAGIDELHPIVMRYEGDEPCIPLRLTSIAAEDDMGVRAFFFGDARVVPTNYRHVELNPLAVDWSTGGSNYFNVVAAAADEGVDVPGRAFVTEYAGSTSVVPADQIDVIEFPYSIASIRVEGPADVETVIDELQSRGLVRCDTSRCRMEHPLIEGILRDFLPPPEGELPSQFYACPTCWPEEELDFSRWDGFAFVDRMQREIAKPSLRANALLRDSRVLTRLYTEISAEEMLSDPIFVENPDLPNYPFEHSAAVRVRCDGASVYTFEDGRKMLVAGQWPSDFDDLPAERVEVGSTAGAPVSEVDFGDEIDATLITRNERFIERRGISVEAVPVEWGGGIEPAEDADGDERATTCSTAPRNLSGALWMALIFGIVGIGRRRMMR